MLMNDLATYHASGTLIALCRNFHHASHETRNMFVRTLTKSYRDSGLAIHIAHSKTLRVWEGNYFWHNEHVTCIFNLPSFEKTSTSQRLRLPSTPTSWMATYCPMRGRAQVKAFVDPSSMVPGCQAHSGFLCRSVLEFPTRISKSWRGLWPQQPREWIRTTFTVCGASKSTLHHGDGSRLNRKSS